MVTVAGGGVGAMGRFNLGGRVRCVSDSGVTVVGVEYGVLWVGVVVAVTVGDAGAGVGAADGISLFFCVTLVVFFVFRFGRIIM